jgi:hypothetical protein
MPECPRRARVDILACFAMPLDHFDKSPSNRSLSGLNKTSLQTLSVTQDAQGKKPASLVWFALGTEINMKPLMTTALAGIAAFALTQPMTSFAQMSSDPAAQPGTPAPTMPAPTDQTMPMPPSTPAPATDPAMPAPSEPAMPTPPATPADPAMPAPTTPADPAAAAPAAPAPQMAAPTASPPPAPQAVYPPCSATLHDQCTNVAKGTNRKRAMKKRG